MGGATTNVGQPWMSLWAGTSSGAGAAAPNLMIGIASAPQNIGGYPMSIYGIIPPNNYYYLNQGNSGYIFTWSELS